MAIINVVRDKNHLLHEDETARITEASKESSSITRFRMIDDPAFKKDLDLNKNKEITSMNIDNDKEKTLDKNASKN